MLGLELDPGSAIWWTGALGAIATLITTGHFLSGWRHFQNEGFYGWTSIRRRLRPERRPRWIVRLLDAVLSYPTIVLVLAGRALASVSILASQGLGPIFCLGVLYIHGTNVLVLGLRTPTFPGGDAMLRQTFGALAIVAVFPKTDLSLRAALAFLALALCVAYFSCGLAKLRASDSVWRRGTALGIVMSSNVFGYGPVSRILAARPRLAKALTWSVVGFEISFPLVLLAPPELCFAMLLLGLLFHLSIAMTMGLTSFLWAFLSAYPAILFWCG